MRRLAWLIGVALSVSVTQPASSASTSFTFSDCTDLALVLPIPADRARTVVPDPYRPATVSEMALLYLNTVRCGDSKFHIAAVGIEPPVPGAGLTPPIGPGRRDHYLLTFATTSTSLVAALQRSGLPITRATGLEVEEVEAVAGSSVTASVQLGAERFALQGDFARPGSPEHAHEHHWWWDDRGTTVELQLDITMVDRLGMATTSFTPGSRWAALGAEPGTGAAFLNRNDLVAAIRRH